MQFWWALSRKRENKRGHAQVVFRRWSDTPTERGEGHRGDYLPQGWVCLTLPHTLCGSGVPSRSSQGMVRFVRQERDVFSSTLPHTLCVSKLPNRSSQGMVRFVQQERDVFSSTLPHTLCAWEVPNRSSQGMIRFVRQERDVFSSTLPHTLCVWGVPNRSSQGMIRFVRQERDVFSSTLPHTLCVWGVPNRSSQGCSSSGVPFPLEAGNHPDPTHLRPYQRGLSPSRTGKGARHDRLAGKITNRKNTFSKLETNFH